MNNAEHFDRTAFKNQTQISEEAVARFETWLTLLRQANEHTNLVGRSTLEQFWFRHALDSWQIFNLAPDKPVWADLGSGAGFPGVAVAFGLMERETPNSQVYCVESIQKKAGFLKSVSRETGAPLTVINDRVESIQDLPMVDIVTARAMAPLDKLLNYVKPFVDNGAIALLPKGGRFETELTEAQKNWTFEHEVIPSLTAPDARILKIRGLERVRKQKQSTAKSHRHRQSKGRRW
jgi:16S rRNA (guanine527-N7)-methyltransferase